MAPKTQEKVKKAVDDKTFGMKNKKGAKAKEFIQQIQKNVAPKDAGPSRKAIKEAREKEQAEIDALFKPAVTKKAVTLGGEGDPKLIVCEYYKMGKCAKGAKCKFSHDVSVERKEAKIDLYSDRRDDQIEDWDDEKLAEVVEKKDRRAGPQTDIVCKYFIEAIENKKYGWFWECPNGGDACMYRHRLPPGFVFKADMKKGDEGPVLTLEEIIETEREKIKNGTPVTLESFKIWKEKKVKEKAELAEAEAKAQAKEKEANKGKMKIMSGKALFEFNPDLFVDDDEAEDKYEREGSEDDEEQEAMDKAIASGEAGVVVDQELFEGLEDLDVDDDDEGEGGEGEEEGEEEGDE